MKQRAYPPMVIVTWHDAQDLTEWTDKLPDVSVMKSVGFFRRATKTKVMIARDVDLHREDAVYFGASFAIPRGSVVDIKEIDAETGAIKPFNLKESA